MADIEVKGLADLDRYLKEFPAKLEAKILRGAMRAGSKVFLDLAKQKVPSKTGALRKSLRISTRLKQGRTSATVVAGDKVAFYAHMVEFGTARHWIKPSKRKSLFFAGIMRETIDHPGARPQPFMRPAFDEGTQGAIEASRDYTARRIEKEMAKK